MPKRAAHPSITALLIILSVMVSMVSCAPHAERDRLRRAEALMESDAKAASAVLDSIRPTTLRGEARARYALLHTQADYKNYVPLTTDSLILIATRHYGTRRKTLPAALSQYYLGCTYKDMGRDLDAIDALLRATILFPDSTNKYYAYSFSELGLLYLSHKMGNEATKALETYRQIIIDEGDVEKLSNASYQLGRAYLYTNDSEKALAAFKEVISLPSSSQQRRKASTFQLAKLYLYSFSNIEDAENNIDAYLTHYSKERGIGAAHLVKADILKQRGERKSAYQYYMKALNDIPELSTRCSAYRSLAEIAPLLQKADSASFFIKKYEELLDSTYSEKHAKEINELITNHTIELHDREMAERHNRLLWILGLSALVFVAGSTISLLMVKKRQQADKLAYQEELALLRREQIYQSVQEDEPMDNADPAITDADCEAAPDDTATVQPRFDYFRKSVEAYRIQFGKSEWAALLKNNQADILLKNKLSADKGAAMMTYITDLFSDLFIHLLNENPALSRLDLEYCAMVMLRMKTDQMAYCTQATVHSYHCRHGKVRDKLTDDWYALIFGKPKHT